jgi:hypothetical protein
MSLLRPDRRSIVRAAIALVLGFVSMGALGGALHLLVAPTLPAAYRRINDLSGDWVWPAMISVGMAWSVGFLVAGAFDRLLAGQDRPRAVRLVTYLAVLWGWAALLWNGVARLR